ncbi:MAG TPA: vanadium-dependent haloperoxidase [Polyangiaceae bacterium]|jgi:hypothetical protein|nr:vanadium-dependent haloperoxidase [Polyangiaceae bacterium]
MLRAGSPSHSEARGRRWPAAGRLFACLACLSLTACGSLASQAERRGADAVTEWTLIADFYGGGASNWRTLAIMHMAMHDALNAAHPVYARWLPASADEPSPEGADPEVAMAAAAEAVLERLHPQHAADTADAFATVLARYPDGPGKTAGVRLGQAIGRAAATRRADDGFYQVRYFPGDEAVGRWRPTPPDFGTSPTNAIRPFLFSSVEEVPSEPPLILGSPAYVEQREQTRAVGSRASTTRTPEETNDAYFWAYQSSQRGFMELAARLLAARRPADGPYGEARILAQLAAALADSAILTWNEKAKFNFWRPVTAIRAEDGDPAWEPLIATPPFPEYPSGHATDCFVGAEVLQASLPGLSGPITYRSSAYFETLHGAKAPPPETFGMGQHAQPVDDPPGGRSIQFPTLGAAADNCADSRIWAGAHFMAAKVESQRLANVIVQHALAAVPARAGAPLSVSSR